MKVPRDDDLRIVALMPVLCSPRATPGGEARRSWNMDQVTSQRIVIHQDCLHSGGKVFQPTFGLRAALCTPIFTALPGRRIQEKLVSTDGTFLTCPGDDLVASDVVGPEAVVVEQEKWCDGIRSAGPIPYFERVFRRRNSILPGAGNKGTVSHLTSKGFSIPGFRDCPQIMVAGNPEHFFKFPGQCLKCQPHMFEFFANVAGDDKPVILERVQSTKGLAIGFTGEMQIAYSLDGVEPGDLRLTMLR